MADVLITAESQAQINADGTRSCIHLPNVEAEAEHIRAAFGNRADKHSRISVGRLDELLKDKRIWFCPAHGDAMLQGEPVLAFDRSRRTCVASVRERAHLGQRRIGLGGSAARAHRTKFTAAVGSRRGALQSRVPPRIRGGGGLCAVLVRRSL